MTLLPTTTAWAVQPAKTAETTFSDEDLDVVRKALTAGVEVRGKKPELPRLLPSDTTVKAVGKVLEKDLPLYFKNTEDSAVYVYLPQEAIVSVLEDCEEKFRVSYNNWTGFVSAEAIELFKRNDTFACYGVVDTEELSVYAEAAAENENAEPVATLTGGARIEVSAFRQGWFAVKSGDIAGFVSGDSLDLTLEKEAPKPVVKTPPKEEKKTEGTAEEEADSKTEDSSSAVVNGSGSDIAAYAMQFVGVPYVYGGASPSGFDCSGFTRYVFAQFGVKLPHGATPQLNSGAEVSRDNLQPGDLVFFQGTYATSSAASHCGIYIGDGQFIHSASSGNRGITISNLSDSYYSRHYLTARRVEM
ncbi:MAG: C40 family peptidase [Oscillospiraceae bacterium]|nr:C40 family peptidase [Oscillospiraceae bacterium]